MFKVISGEQLMWYSFEFKMFFLHSNTHYHKNNNNSTLYDINHNSTDSGGFEILGRQQLRSIIEFANWLLSYVSGTWACTRRMVENILESIINVHTIDKSEPVCLNAYVCINVFLNKWK
jgi:hypothetical protein